MHVGFFLILYFTEINKMYAEFTMDAASFKTLAACTRAEKRFLKKFPPGTLVEIEGKTYQVGPSCEKKKEKK